MTDQYQEMINSLTGVDTEPKITKPSELLRAAKKVITNPEKWTKGYLARDANYNPVSEDSPDAVCWCSIGAFCKAIPKEAMDTPFDRDAFSFLSVAAHELDASCYGIAAFNDVYEHEQVMQLWDHAISLAEAIEAATAS